MLDIQDFLIVLGARHHNSTMVTPDFLKGSGVVPGGWELSRSLSLSCQANQAIFNNAINSHVQAGTVSFSKHIDAQALNNIELPSLARRYCVTLPNLA